MVLVTTNAATEFTNRYIERVQNTLRIEISTIGPPTCALPGRDTLRQLRDQLNALVAKSGTVAVESVRNSEGALLQTVAYGAFEDLEFAVKIGLLLGDRVVIWDLLASRLLVGGRNDDRAEVISAVGNALVALKPLADEGALVILPHPLSWHPEAQSAFADLARANLLTPSLVGLTATLAVAHELQLHPYTVAESDDAFSEMLEARALADGDQALFRTTVAALSASRIFSGRLVEFLRLPAREIRCIVRDRADFYRSLRDRLVGDTDADTEYRRRTLESELEDLIDNVNGEVRSFAQSSSTGLTLLAAGISVLLAAKTGRLSLIAPALGLTANTIKAVAQSGTDKPVLHTVFREIGIEHARREFPWQGSIETRHHYLLSLTPGLARTLLREMSDDHIDYIINVRRDTWHDYCAEFLVDLWDIDQESFWRHARIAFNHPEEGMTVSDIDRHWELLEQNPMPDDVWLACLNSIPVVAPHDDWSTPEQTQRVVVAQLNLDDEHVVHRRKLLVDWAVNLPDSTYDIAFKFLRTAFGDNVPDWFAQFSRATKV